MCIYIYICICICICICISCSINDTINLSNALMSYIMITRRRKLITTIV